MLTMLSICKKKKPQISVIISAYNQEKYIGRCLRSLVNQSLGEENYEILVVNDGSTDKTSFALSLFHDAISIINNKNNIGLPASINKAIKKAEGRFIVRVDADDYVNIDFLKLLYVFLINNLDVDAVACDYWFVDDKENRIRRASAKREPIACGILFYKKHLLEIGLYDKKFLWHEEKELRVRFEKKYSIEFLKVPLYRYRKHNNNHSNNEKEMNNHYKKLVLKHRKI